MYLSTLILFHIRFNTIQSKKTILSSPGKGGDKEREKERFQYTSCLLLENSATANTCTADLL